MNSKSAGSTEQTRVSKNPFLTFAALVIILAGMKAASPILNPLFLSFFTAIVCWPLLTWLGRKGLPSEFAVTLVILGLVIVLITLGAYLVSAINKFSSEIPIYQANLSQQTKGLFEWLHEYDISFPESAQIIKELDAGKAMKFAGVLLSGFSNVFANIFFILITVVFILLESYALPVKMKYAFGQSKINENASKIITSINQYLAIKVITSLATGLFITLWLMLLGVDFPVLWGVVAFMLNFVPNIGSIIAAIPTVLLALVQLGGHAAFLAVLGYLLVNTVVGNLWEPRIMGRGLGLSTLVVFLSMALWGWVFGPVGMFLSVPFTMIAKIILENNPDTRWIAILLGSDKDLETEETEIPPG